jgi:hypothetical protein
LITADHVKRNIKNIVGFKGIPITSQ